MSDRKKAIETLKQLRLDYEEFYEEHNNEVTQAYDMAIASLETDEAYQLEFENRDCVEVVRCKDCKYYRNKENKRSYCTKRLNVDSVTDRYREPNFYCADAVLREVVEE